MPLNWAKPGAYLISFGFHRKPMRCCCDCHHFTNGDLKLREVKYLVRVHTARNGPALSAQMDPSPEPRPLLNPASCSVFKKPPASYLHSVGSHSTFLIDPGLVQQVTEEEHPCIFSFYKTPPNKVLSDLIFFTLSVELPSPLAHVHVPYSGRVMVPSREEESHNLGPRNPAVLTQPLRISSGTHLSPFITPLSPRPIHNQFMKMCRCGAWGAVAVHLERGQERNTRSSPPFYR